MTGSRPPQLPARDSFVDRTLPYGVANASRLRRLVTLSCTILFAGSASSVGATVFGEDERLRLESTLTAGEVALYGATQMIFLRSAGQ